MSKGEAVTQRRRLALDEVGSTNTVAMEAARHGDPGPLWVTAERQVQGRGRRGRTWVSERGNLYASWLLVDPAPLEHLGNLPLVASLGVRNGLGRLMRDRDHQVMVKWPNDVLIGDAKCVGILLESERLSNSAMAVVVGCGINVAHMPEETTYRITSLAREGVSDGLDAVFDAVASGVERAMLDFDGGAGFARIRQDWLSHATGIGKPCRIATAHAVLTGRFEALDPQGRLILRAADGSDSAISAGDLFFLADDRREAAISA